MKNESNDMDKIILGFVIGGLMGGAAFYLLKASPKERKLFFGKIEKMITETGEFLKDIEVDSEHDAIEDIKKSLPKGDLTANVLTMAAMGLNIWKKMKKGKKT